MSKFVKIFAGVCAVGILFAGSFLVLGCSNPGFVQKLDAAKAVETPSDASPQTPPAPPVVEAVAPDAAKPVVDATPPEVVVPEVAAPEVAAPVVEALPPVIEVAAPPAEVVPVEVKPAE